MNRRKIKERMEELEFNLNKYKKDNALLRKTLSIYSDPEHIYWVESKIIKDGKTSYVMKSIKAATRLAQLALNSTNKYEV